MEREQDEASQARLSQAKQEFANVQEELAPLREKYEQEKQRSKGIQEARLKLDSLGAKLEEAKRNNDFATASDLQYYAIPELRERIETLEKEKAALLGQLKDDDLVSQSNSML